MWQLIWVDPKHTGVTRDSVFCDMKLVLLCFSSREGPHLLNTVKQTVNLVFRASLKGSSKEIWMNVKLHKNAYKISIKHGKDGL